MTLYRDQGVVLRTYKLGEADRIVVLLTAGHGKVRAVAKGVRKTKSRFGGRLEPTSQRQPAAVRGARARRGHPGRADRPFPAHPRGPGPDDRRHGPARGGRPGRPGAGGQSPLYQMLVGALRTLAERRGSAARPGLLLEAAQPRGRRVRCSTRAPAAARRPSRSSWSPSTSPKAAPCAGPCRQRPALSAEALALMRRILGGGLGRALLGPSRAATTRRAGCPRPPTRSEVASRAAAAAGAPAPCRPRLSPATAATGRQVRATSLVAHGPGDGRDRQPLQAPRLRLPVGRDLRRLPLHLRLRPARRLDAAQRQGRLVARDGAAARRRGRPRCRHPLQPEDLGGVGPPRQLHRPAGRLPQLQRALAGRPSRSRRRTA